MNLVPYVSNNLAGAWRLMLGRPEGLNRLDTSLEGFWRSFGAIVLIAPFALVTLLGQQLAIPDAAEPAPQLTGGWFVAKAFTLLVEWFAFPLVFALVARPFGLGSRYVPFIVARNWASVIIGAMVGAMNALQLLLLPPAAMPYVLIAAIAIVLRFSYVVARLALAVSAGMAIPIVVLDLLLSLVILSAFERLT